MKIGFIGFGNMAQAIVQGLIAAKAVSPDEIFACAAHYEKLKTNAASFGVHAEESAKAVAEQADMVVIAVKPYQIETVVEPIKELLFTKIVVSIAAGRPFAWYEQVLLPGTHHISTIPNTPVSVCEGIFVCEQKHSLTEDEWNAFCNLFSAIALIEPVDSDHLSIAGTLSGCAPAYTAMYMEALADAAVKHGVARQTAYRLAAQMIVGTGKLQLSTGAHPGAMKDAVCSPGGTTIKGVAALEENGFRNAVMKAIDAAES